jgi:hypothetical protein
VFDHPVQRLVADVVSWRSSAGLSRRGTPLPVIGEQARQYLTTVLRLNVPLPEFEVADRHYRYPAHTVHVTVANVGRTSTSLVTALERLSGSGLAPVTLRLYGLGCSPDTIFIRVLYDKSFVRLRKAVRRAFDVPSGPFRSVRSLPYSAMAFANVIRFDGAGERPPRNMSIWGKTTIDTMEIVLTDRVLSDEGTQVLASINLRGARGGAGGGSA